MRELKFRAWYPKSKKMTYSDIEGWGSFGDCELSDMEHGDCIIMLYIGKMDKHNNEICDNDIIICTVTGGEIGIEKAICKVEYDKSLASFTIIGNVIDLESNVIPHLANKKDGKWWLNLFECWDIEIIGNIYQNPELLK